MVKILLSNIGSIKNEGIAMMLRAITENIKADFYYHKLTVCKGYEKFGIRGSWRCWGYDVALDLGGDTFTTYYGTLQFLRHCLHLFLLWFFGQPYVIFAQTLCPYGLLSFVIAAFFLKRAKLIMVREEKSFWYIRNLDLLMNLNFPKTYLTADITFLLDVKQGHDYCGSSYHMIIKSILSGHDGCWNGQRKENWKFTIFDGFNLNEYREKAEKNVSLLSRLLQYS